VITALSCEVPETGVPVHGRVLLRKENIMGFLQDKYGLPRRDRSGRQRTKALADLADEAMDGVEDVEKRLTFPPRSSRMNAAARKRSSGPRFRIGPNQEEIQMGTVFRFRWERQRGERTLTLAEASTPACARSPNWG